MNQIRTGLSPSVTLPLAFISLALMATSPLSSSLFIDSSVALYFLKRIQNRPAEMMVAMQMPPLSN